VINGCSVTIFAAFLIALSWQIALVAFVGSHVLSWCIRLLSAPVRKLGVEAKRINQLLAERSLMTLQGMRHHAVDPADRTLLRRLSIASVVNCNHAHIECAGWLPCAIWPSKRTCSRSRKARDMLCMSWPNSTK
jgi:hypothetical protein